jgi:hypothetical protein
MGPLRGNRIDWVWNTRFIPDQEFLDMMRQACTVLKMVATGHWAFMMVKKLTPLNFLEVLRALVIGEERDNVQQAAKLKSITTGVPLNAPEGFVPQGASPPAQHA